MRAILQRVKKGSVRVGDQILEEIGQGLVILLGVGPDDGEENARQLAEQIATLRIFSDEEGKMNLSVLDVSGEALVIPQFTLYADTRKGNRPSFTGAAAPSLAQPLVERFVSYLKGNGVPTKSGKFGAYMLVEIHNDGPVTISLDS